VKPQSGIRGQESARRGAIYRALFVLTRRRGENLLTTKSTKATKPCSPDKRSAIRVSGIRGQESARRGAIYRALFVLTRSRGEKPSTTKNTKATKPCSPDKRSAIRVSGIRGQESARRGAIYRALFVLTRRRGENLQPRKTRKPRNRVARISEAPSGCQVSEVRNQRVGARFIAPCLASREGAEKTFNHEKHESHETV